MYCHWTVHWYTITALCMTAWSHDWYLVLQASPYSPEPGLGVTKMPPQTLTAVNVQVSPPSPQNQVSYFSYCLTEKTKHFRYIWHCGTRLELVPSAAWCQGMVVMVRRWPGDIRAMVRQWSGDGRAMVRRYLGDGRVMAGWWSGDGRAMVGRWSGDGREMAKW